MFVSGRILHVDVGGGKCRLGGTAFAQCYKQLGNQPPDLDHPEALRAAFSVTQKLIKGCLYYFLIQVKS